MRKPALFFLILLLIFIFVGSGLFVYNNLSVWRAPQIPSKMVDPTSADKDFIKATYITQIVSGKLVHFGENEWTIEKNGRQVVIRNENTDPRNEVFFFRLTSEPLRRERITKSDLRVGDDIEIRYRLELNVGQVIVESITIVLP